MEFKIAGNYEQVSVGAVGADGSNGWKYVACIVPIRQDVAKGGAVEKKGKRNKDTKDMQEPKKKIGSQKPSIRT